MRLAMNDGKEAGINKLRFKTPRSYRLETVQEFRGQRGWSLEKAMTPHSSTLAWKIPWTEEPGGLWFMVSLRV